MRRHILIIVFSLGLLFVPQYAQEVAFPMPSYKVKKVVIDAGHGGKDSGCLGSKTYEKDIVLPIALKLGGYIEQYLSDVEVIYTRTTDKFIELHERADIANRNQADLFISIHCNSADKQHSVHGTETYVMGLKKSHSNLEVAKRENAAILLEDNYLESYDGFNPNEPETHIIFSLYQNAFRDQSILFASLVEEQFKERNKRVSRGVKQEEFIVLYKSGMPSVLIETGFLTNNKEEEYLRSENGKDYVASSIFRAFRTYKKQIEARSILSDDEYSDQ